VYVFYYCALYRCTLVNPLLSALPYYSSDQWGVHDSEVDMSGMCVCVCVFVCACVQDVRFAFVQFLVCVCVSLCVSLCVSVCVCMLVCVSVSVSVSVCVVCVVCVMCVCVCVCMYVRLQKGSWICKESPE
jgi:hypothetical protein